jgi:peptidoglycan/LPS O-acetylase OafA/YrhL
MLGKFEFGVVHLAIALPLTVLLAMVSYRYIERPIMIDVGRRLRARAADGPGR